MQALLADKVFLYSAVAILSFLITQGLKWILVKPWTRKLSNKTVAKAINSIIFLFPYGVGIALEIVISVYLTNSVPNLLIGALNGGAGHSVFALYERAWDIATRKFTKKRSNATTEEEKAAEELVFSSTEDNKIDKDDSPALAAFLEKVK